MPVMPVMFAIPRYYQPVAYLLPKLALDALLLRAVPVALYTACVYPLVRVMRSRSEPPACIHARHDILSFDYPCVSL